MIVNDYFNFDFYHPGKKLFRLFWSGVLRRISISFLSFFSAIYIYELFLDMGKSSQFAIYMIGIFYILLIVFKQVTLAVSENLSQKLGFGGVLKLSIIPFFFTILFLIFSKNTPLLVFLAAALWGICAGLYWWGYHGYFIKMNDNKKFGEGIGEVELLRTLATIITPIVGAVVIESFGFKFVFILSFLTMLIATILPRKKDDVSQKHDVNYKSVWFSIWKHKSMTLAYLSTGAEYTVYSFAWTLFLYFYFGNVLRLGEVISLSLVFSAILGFFVGRYVDKKGERKIVSLGVPIFSLSWLVRSLSKTFPVFVFSDTLRNVSEKLLSLPLMELSYKKGVEGYAANAILFREITIGIGSMLAVILVFLVTLLGFNIRFTFWLMFAISFLPFLIVLKKRI